VGTNMTIIGGRKLGSWERRKSRKKRERQKAVSEVSDIERKECRICEVSVSHSGADEDSRVLGC